MNDSDYAVLARDLADALMAYARDRRDDDKKRVAQLQTELCMFRRAEIADARDAPDEPHSVQ